MVCRVSENGRKRECAKCVMLCYFGYCCYCSHCTLTIFFSHYMLRIFYFFIITIKWLFFLSLCLTHSLFLTLPLCPSISFLLFSLTFFLLTFTSYFLSPSPHAYFLFLVLCNNLSSSCNFSQYRKVLVYLLLQRV